MIRIFGGLKDYTLYTETIACNLFLIFLFHIDTISHHRDKTSLCVLYMFFLYLRRLSMGTLV